MHITFNHSYLWPPFQPFSWLDKALNILDSSRGFVLSIGVIFRVCLQHICRKSFYGILLPFRDFQPAICHSFLSQLSDRKSFCAIFSLSLLPFLDWLIARPLIFLPRSIPRTYLELNVSCQDDKWQILSIYFLSAYGVLNVRLKSLSEGFRCDCHHVFHLCDEQFHSAKDHVLNVWTLLAYVPAYMSWSSSILKYIHPVEQCGHFSNLDDSICAPVKNYIESNLYTFVSFLQRIFMSEGAQK